VLPRPVSHVTSETFTVESLMPRARSVGGIASIALFLACSDSSGPDRLSFVGSYSATVLVVTAVSLHPVDYIAAGSTLTITIAEDSSVTGHLTIPAAITGGADFDADMAGVAAVTEATVIFDQAAVTFVRGLTFTRHHRYLEVNSALAAGPQFHIRLDRVDR
jgi:hypothetical protein